MYDELKDFFLKRKRSDDRKFSSATRDDSNRKSFSNPRDCDYLIENERIFSDKNFLDEKNRGIKYIFILDKFKEDKENPFSLHFDTECFENINKINSDSILYYPEYMKVEYENMLI